MAAALSDSKWAAGEVSSILLLSTEACGIDWKKHAYMKGRDLVLDKAKHILTP